MTERVREPHYRYLVAFEAIKSRIEAGELPPNAPLPAERRLAQELGFAIGTVRHATRLLREHGFVVTVRSKGTFVAPDVGPSDGGENDAIQE
ncbi:winged helix-turn-helix domain-containing protein [Amycolatopsis tucumanensis]|uniref:HTH gntR-type domain-containing protein n=1 Tax=Amycolatopsis tucumanensis TaxID=401106 RepID=A0ABP7JPY4_9PSEU|nr:winged helix-turn-helix domain-containing protein [Amycolatopsis tucumanensis]MCF6424966.1 winged helix-turn-helix domain-containing protein [Amycolatopsis tucumanensis]